MRKTKKKWILCLDSLLFNVDLLPTLAILLFTCIKVKGVTFIDKHVLQVTTYSSVNCSSSKIRSPLANTYHHLWHTKILRERQAHLNTSPDLLVWQQSVVIIFWIICILGSKQICHVSSILCQLKRVNLYIAIYCLHVTFLQLNLASTDVVTFPDVTRKKRRKKPTFRNINYSPLRWRKDSH